MLLRKDVAVTLRYDDREIDFATGRYAKTRAFLTSLETRGDIPKTVLDQYQELLNERVSR
ncbi:hypothetical protein FFF34_010105 [Inquilinus sp. KBS0705]|nr:hypothetical protein FFF34_010105 [Inquilinus sp. KBS0705]